MPALLHAQTRVQIDAAGSGPSFVPQEVFGAAVDGVPQGAVAGIYQPDNVASMLQAGLGAVSYRLYTELSVQDWHWNPRGHFSGAGGGYWISDARPDAAHPLRDTYGYRLPRRGNTHDQGNDDDYGRLTDGDPATYWKSNPYLTQGFTGEDDALHPQWVLLDLGQPRTLTALRIFWAVPYATQYSVQYFTGGDAIYDPAGGSWVDYPGGDVANGQGGDVTLPLGAAPQAQFIRVLMRRSSHGCPAPAGSDARDCAGYAVAELYAGTLDASGNLHDVLHHAPDQTQTATYVSSTDPWHGAADRVRDQEQPGFDVVFDSGLTRGLGAMVPVPMLYSTPQNAVAELAYLKASGRSIAYVELGEEPDGQYVAPEDYGALYLQWAAALHGLDPSLRLGGPVYQGTLGDVATWADAAGNTSWTARFLAYLARHGRSQDLSFFSFEHYPDASCDSATLQANLAAEPARIRNVLAAMHHAGVPADMKIFISEANFSQNESDIAQQVSGALWLADFFGSLIQHGAAGGYLYEYEPIPLSPAYPCRGYGSYGILRGNAAYHAGQKLAQFWAMQMLRGQWVRQADARYTLLRSTVQPSDANLGAYAARDSAGRIALLLVNRDLAQAKTVTLDFGGGHGFAGPVLQTSFSAAQYAWVESGAASRASPDHAPLSQRQAGGDGTAYVLPPGALVVLRLAD